MIQITAQMRILLAVEPVDFCRGIDGLAALCRAALNSDLQDGTLFIFCARNRSVPLTPDEHDQCRERRNGGAAGNSDKEIVDLAESIARLGKKGAQGRLIEYHLAATAFPVIPDRNRMKRE